MSDNDEMTIVQNACSCGWELPAVIVTVDGDPDMHYDVHLICPKCEACLSRCSKDGGLVLEEERRKRPTAAPHSTN